MSRLYSDAQRPGPEPVFRFSEEEIERARKEHDRRMGFSLDLASVFTNPARLPETHVGPPETLWNK